MWAAILAYLNPKNIFQALTLLKWVFDISKSGYQFIKEFFSKKKQQEKIDQLSNAESKINEANKIEDEQERLKKKAEAARDIENAIKYNN